ncbi:BREX-1 system adenine-specific DNA-methyltransferase PglX [Nocardia sp. CA-128927]|uniref:BREX-1 system adenine-specific DNA-methyltransferase PglX n=1 Tax=Nocardia sp. CA-128927 TaxID=3239975 RepID=UPI003D99CE4C
MAHLGTRAFDSISGEVVQTTAFVIDTEKRPGHKGVFIRLVDGKNEASKRLALSDAVVGSNNSIQYVAAMNDFALVPESPIVYWLSDAMKAAFGKGTRLADIASPRQGLATADNDRFLRQWFEVSGDRVGFGMTDRRAAEESHRKWFPHNKGGSFRKWWGNQDYVINWENDGKELWDFRPRSVLRNPDKYFKPCVSWSNVSSGAPAFRRYPSEFIFSHVGQAVFAADDTLSALMGFLDSSVSEQLLAILSPAMHFEVGHIANLPVIPADQSVVGPIVDELTAISHGDWDDYEISWEFDANPLATLGEGPLETHAKTRWNAALSAAEIAQDLEERNNRYFTDLYNLQGEVPCDVSLSRISLTQNPYFRYAHTKGASRTADDYRNLFNRDLAKELISYAVGCMMGRYSLDRPGLILADAGATLADFDRMVPDAQFRADDAGIIPITAESYFEDDIVVRLRAFLAVAFGREHLAANVTWLEHTLGNGKPMSLRKYFLEKFYDDHVKMYSKRPIYWQASSPKGGFNALFYLHRYTPATLGLLHQNYAEDYLAKLSARIDTIEHALPSAGKGEAAKLVTERDDLDTQIREVRGWIQDHLFPLATAEIALDLDDGVKQNYPKLSGVVRKVSGL